MRSSAGEHLVHTEGVTGSIPVASTIFFKGLAKIRKSTYPRPYRIASGVAVGGDEKAYNEAVSGITPSITAATPITAQVATAQGQVNRWWSPNSTPARLTNR